MSAGGSGAGPSAAAADVAAEQERVARAALTRVAEPGDALLHRAVSALGAAQVLAGLLRGDASDWPDRVLTRRMAGYQVRLQDLDPVALVEDACAAGIRLLCPGEQEWPSQLDELAYAPRRGSFELVPPLCLWVRGDADVRLSALRSVAVIGARAASAYGEHVAAELAAGLAQRGWTVVSGAAYGVDAAAHRGALAVDGTTLAVMACGPDVVYPRGHELLLHRIDQSGAVVSELPPKAMVTRSRLLQRNRLVAALTRGVVVVEAAVRSGTATTAGNAAVLGRTVMAVPGPVTSATSVGCHELVRAGSAVLVTDAADVVDAVGRIGADAAAPRRGEERPEDALSGVELRVLDALPVRRAVGVARLASTAGLDLTTVRSALGGLLAGGLAECDSGGYRISAALRRERSAGPDGDASVSAPARP